MRMSSITAPSCTIKVERIGKLIKFRLVLPELLQHCQQLVSCLGCGPFPKFILLEVGVGVFVGKRWLGQGNNSSEQRNIRDQTVVMVVIPEMGVKIAGGEIGSDGGIGGISSFLEFFEKSEKMFLGEAGK
ncbi:hypothetical protein Tco_0664102 [Tanacetum coccineum]